jgi:hypothetical protein
MGRRLQAVTATLCGWNIPGIRPDLVAMSEMDAFTEHRAPAGQIVAGQFTDPAVGSYLPSYRECGRQARVRIPCYTCMIDSSPPRSLRTVRVSTALVFWFYYCPESLEKIARWANATTVSRTEFPPSLTWSPQLSDISELTLLHCHRADPHLQ